MTLIAFLVYLTLTQMIVKHLQELSSPGSESCSIHTFGASAPGETATLAQINPHSHYLIALADRQTYCTLSEVLENRSVV